MIRCRLLHIMLFMFIALPVMAQIVHQPCRVREIAYSSSAPVVPIENVSVKVQTEERSDSRGRLVLKIPRAVGGTFTFSSIYKYGYTLISPAASEMHSTRYALNPNYSVEIIMVNDAKLSAERQRIKGNLMAAYNKVVEKKKLMVEELKAKSEIYYKSGGLVYSDITKQCDSLNSEIRTLEASRMRINSFIDAEADRLSHIDYMTLDSIEIKNLNLRKEGKGDELVKFNMSLLPCNVDDITLGLSANIRLLDSEIKKDEHLQNYMSDRYKNIADGFIAKGETDSAAEYMRQRMEINGNNAEYALDYADYLYSLNEKDLAKKAYLKAVSIDSAAYSPAIIKAYRMLGNIYSDEGDYLKSMDSYIHVLEAGSMSQDEDSVDLCSLYHVYLKALTLHLSGDAIVKAHDIFKMLSPRQMKLLRESKKGFLKKQR
jgi:tetratricopeptide (TPR) repeat protein